MASNENIYSTGEKPKSKILNNSFVNRLNSLFGWRTSKGSKSPETEIEKRYGIKFVRVDLNNPSYRIHNAALGTSFTSKTLNTQVEKYLDEYLKETTTSYSDIADRIQRLNELSFMFYNDVYIFKSCELVATEATQLDVQDRLITIESPNAAFIEKTYELFNQWGITQQTIYATCLYIQLYGEAFWAHTIDQTGIKRIKPLDPQDIIERLEFSPNKMARYIAERDGWQASEKNREQKLKKLIDLANSSNAMDEAENFADMFDDKLFGYELNDGLVVPPWLITHFRFNAGIGEFYPYGRPPLINCLAPFKLVHSTMALQGLARQMSFPVQCYKVKGTEGMLPPQAFNLVNQVRQQYDNIGVSVGTQGDEAYTINTKIWQPDDLMQLEVIESKCDFDFIDDLENYQNMLSMGTGVPRGYIDPSEEGYKESGVCLMEQYKPFAHHVYNVQSTFLQGLGELVRLHYAITGEFDYNTQFILSMRFPADEVSDQKRSSQTATIEMAQSIIDLIKAVLGISEEDPLPEDVVTDILSKYSFLDPTEIQKWMRLSAFLKPSSGGGDDGGGDGGDDMSMDDFGGGDDMGGDMGGDDGGEDNGFGESLSAAERAEILKKKAVLRERHERQLKLKEERLQLIRERYNNQKDNIYMQFVEKYHGSSMNNTWQDKNKGRMFYNVARVHESDVNYDMFRICAESNTEVNKGTYDRIREAKQLNEIDRLKKGISKVQETVTDKVIKDMVRRVTEGARFDGKVTFPGTK